VRAAAVLLLALSLASIVSGQSPESLEVSGVTIAAANGEPLARVRVDGPGDERTYPDILTDDHGRFTLRLPRGEPIRLRLSKAGFAVVTTTLTPAAAASPVRIQMEPGAAISGRIVGTDGTPMRARAYVHPETGDHVDPIAAVTDDRGEFRVGGLPPGRYVVTAVSGSTWTVRVTPDGEREWIPYLAMGARVAPPRPPDHLPRRVVVARAGEETAGIEFAFDIEPPNFGGGTVNIKLQDQPLPTGSVSGTVVDERGEPMQGVVVRAQHLRTVNGRVVALTATDPVDTDDRGRFRIFGLRPGEYVVTALVTARLGGPREYAATYAGGALDLDSASRWVIGDTEEGGVGVEMVPAELFSVAGTVLSSTGAPGSGNVRLTLTHRSGRPIPEPRTVSLGPGGSFSFDGLPPGDYVVQANTGGVLGTPAEFGVAFVTVGEGARTPVVVQTVTPSILSGRIIVEEGTGDQPSTTALALSLRVLPADPDRSPPNQSGTASLATQSDGTFYVTGLAGRNRIVLGSALEGWFMKELLVGGSDVAAEPFDFGAGGNSFDDAVLVLSPRGAVITGQPEPERDGRLPTYSALVFSTDSGTRISRSQFIKHVRAAADGTFRVTGLPPGSYYVAAVRNLMPPVGIDEWEPAELERLAGVATRVTVAEGETRTVRPRLALR
jgi:hypothetical protein